MGVWDLGERVEGELGDGEELVLGDEALGATIELAEALVEGHDLRLRDCSSKKTNQQRRRSNNGMLEQKKRKGAKASTHRGSCSAPAPPRCRTGSASTTRYPWRPPLACRRRRRRRSCRWNRRARAGD